MEEDQPQEIFQSPPEYQSRLSRQSNGGSAKRYIAIIAIIVVLLLIILGLFKFMNAGSETTTDLSPTPTLETFPTDTPFPTEAPEETPTETPKASPTSGATTTPKPSGTTSSVDKATGLDRAKLSVHIYNGSGVTGAAKKATDYLEGLGYNVVDFDNADRSDYTSTEIQLVSAKSDYAALLKKDLSANYTVGKTTDTPAAGEPADAVVIIGK